MKVLVSILISAALVTYAALDIHKGAEPWAPKILEMCMNPANTNATGNLRVFYTGQFSMLDRLICFYVNFIQPTLHDIMGTPLLRLMMGAFTAVYCIMAFEGSRRGFKSTLLSAFPLFAFLANLIGIFVVFPLIWLPLSLYYRKKSKGHPENWAITLPQAYGTLLAVIVGYTIPSAILTSPLIEPKSRLEQDFISIWFVLPILIVPIINVCQWVFKKLGSPVERIRDPVLKDRMYIVEGKDAVERSYLFLAVTNMFLYFTSYWFLAKDGIRVLEAIVMLLKAPGSLPADLTFNDLSQILATRTVLIDLIVLSIGFVLWATFQGGLKAGLIVAALSFIVGPTAAVCFFAYYREDTVQNMVSEDPNAKKVLLEAVDKLEKRK
ncbi:uncharacterized protein BX663DRAFT_485136 [Cokeromyces recurvatus]|uniref:uncharacterized protein n=1 Tax=Cokeromyces recurvatus TaxID=90255 RepID=UPI002220D797|nr:uncharacterized protein BX663DRAFT_485136 [Cokeromyces recurvatus]KAI7904311.1 hypothetical protein BX663DRAFT_485136 [Cokeromyces recurvatus]